MLTPSDKIFSNKVTLPNSSNPSTPWWLRVQIYQPKGAVFIQTTLLPCGNLGSSLLHSFHVQELPHGSLGYASLHPCCVPEPRLSSGGTPVCMAMHQCHHMETQANLFATVTSPSTTRWQHGFNYLYTYHFPVLLHSRAGHAYLHTWCVPGLSTWGLCTFVYTCAVFESHNMIVMSHLFSFNLCYHIAT